MKAINLSGYRQCALLPLSRSTAYYRPKGESAENLAVMKEIDRIWMERPTSGSRTIKSRLRSRGHTVAICRVVRLMGQMGLRVIFVAFWDITWRPGGRGLKI